MNDSIRTTRAIRLLTSTLLFVVAVSAVSCGDSTERDTNRVTLLAYESFVLPDDAFAEFTSKTGIEVDIALGGDAGELVAKAALTAGNPEGDVLWGVDNALLTRLVDSGAIEPYVSTAAPISDALVDSGRGVVTPVDFGFVCINFDIESLRARGVDPPSTLEDLVRPEYRGLLAVPNAGSSSPGLAFLLATVVAFPESWAEYWTRLVENDVAITSGWTEAYYSRFTRHGGDRPLVVSYSTSPPAEVLFSDPPLGPDSPAPTGIAVDTCFEQIEFAGVLRGSDNVDAATKLVDFLVRRSFQELLPENLFVYPVNTDARLPESFQRHATPVNRFLRMDSDEIDRRRVDVLDEWARITGS